MAKCGALSITVLVVVLVGAGIITAVFFLLDVDEAIKCLTNCTDVDASMMPSSAPTFDPNVCNGVDGLCDLSASEVLFAMVHNANANEANGNQLPYHEGSIRDALDAGYRGLYLTVSICNGRLVLYNIDCDLGTQSIRSVFETINDFLQNNPREVLLLNIQIDNPQNSEIGLDTIAGQMDLAGDFTNYLYANEVSMPWPTLGDLVDSNKRVLLFYNNIESQDDEPPGFHYWFNFAFETTSSLRNVDEASTPSIACVVDQPSQGALDFFAMNLHLADTPRKQDAAVLNQRSFVREQVRACSQFNGVNANVVSVDWWGIGDVVGAVNAINMERVS